MTHHWTKTDNGVAYAFRYPDGRWLKVERDDCYPGPSMWAEAVDKLEDASLLPSARGLAGDHRWPDMVKDAVPVAVYWQKVFKYTTAPLVPPDEPVV